MEEDDGSSAQSHPASLLVSGARSPVGAHDSMQCCCRGAPSVSSGRRRPAACSMDRPRQARMSCEPRSSCRARSSLCVSFEQRTGNSTSASTAGSIFSRRRRPRCSRSSSTSSQRVFALPGSPGSPSGCQYISLRSLHVRRGVHVDARSKDRSVRSGLSRRARREDQRVDPLDALQAAPGTHRALVLPATVPSRDRLRPFFQF